jgi:hypothetical protein
MKIVANLGIQRFPASGALAVFGVVCHEQKLPQPAAGCPGSATAPAGPAGRHHVRLRTLVNPVFIDLPMTDRLRTSASEP